MAEKFKETARVISQESLGGQIYSMWIQTEQIAAAAKPGQFVSVYCKNEAKLLPRPISLCEIDRENGRLRIVYRVTGEATGTEEFSHYQAGDAIELLGPLGNGFPLERAKGKRVFLIGGGIGIPPMVQLAKELDGTTGRNIEIKNCPVCGQPLKKRNGRFGEFWGCMGFPTCRYTENI